MPTVELAEAMTVTMKMAMAVLLVVVTVLGQTLAPRPTQAPLELGSGPSEVQQFTVQEWYGLLAVTERSASNISVRARQPAK